MSDFSKLDLPEPITKALIRMQYSELTEIQSKAIPPILAGNDIIASAHTGTGKTAAFGIPIISKIIADANACALVLAPTRELALQIRNVLKQLGGFLPSLRVALVIGGDSMVHQSRILRRGPNIIVATPGRLVDHLRQNSSMLAKVSYVVLDEADRMLELGFAEPLKRIRQTLPTERQVVFFSATFPHDISAMAQVWLKNPLKIVVGEALQPAQNVTQSTIEVASEKKNTLILNELKNRQGTVLIFTKTKRRAERLALWLEQMGQVVCRIHGDRTQNQREAALAGFHNGRYRIMVATDVAARGIDVPHIEHVINYDVPFVPQDYIHRIGRTARAGRSGQALSLIAPEESERWSNIQNLLANPAAYKLGSKSEMQSSPTTEIVTHSRRGGSFRSGKRPFRKVSRAPYNQRGKGNLRPQDRQKFDF